MVYTTEELRKIVAPIAQAYGVKSVSVFGSYARGTQTPSSDVDLKIEKGALRSLFQLCGFRLAVEDALARPVGKILYRMLQKRGEDIAKRIQDAADLKEDAQKLLADFLDMDSPLVVSLHIQSLDQVKAIKTIKRKITDLDNSTIEEVRPDRALCSVA